MNSPINAQPEASTSSEGIASTVTAATRPMYWSVKRELWENRSIYIAPLAAASLFLAGFMISTIHLPAKMRAVALNPLQRHEFIEQPYEMAALLLMGTTFIVAIFYCLDALHGERRDRSILFWKSLPVSDVTTVLSKASVPLIILPLVTFGITVVLQLMMLLVSSVVLVGSGLGIATLWTNLSLFQIWLGLLFHLVAVHGLWYGPFYGWMLLVSAWARRAAFLWALVPLFAIGIVERVAFNTSHFAMMVGNRFAGGMDENGTKATGMMDLLVGHSPGHFLISPGLWLGLVFTAACLFAAIRLRRSRGPM